MIIVVAQLVKNPPSMQETWVGSWVGKIPWRRKRLPIPVFWLGEFHGEIMESQAVGHEWATLTSLLYFIINGLMLNFVVSVQFSSVSQSCPTLCDPVGCPSPTPRVYSNSCPLNRWCHPTVSSSIITSPPAFNLSQHQGLFKWVSSSYQVYYHEKIKL